MPLDPRVQLRHRLVPGARSAPVLTPRALPVRTQVQVWQGERVNLLHSVRLAADTVGGVPYTEAPGCDSCRV